MLYQNYYLAIKSIKLDNSYHIYRHLLFGPKYFTRHTSDIFIGIVACGLFDISLMNHTIRSGDERFSDNI